MLHNLFEETIIGIEKPKLSVSTRLLIRLAVSSLIISYNYTDMFYYICAYVIIAFNAYRMMPGS